MKHATIDDFDNVYSYFTKNRKWFPHVRTDYLKRMITGGMCILDREVVITYTIYKKRTKINKGASVYGEKGDCILHQIVSKKGKATEVFTDFFDYINTNLFLSVRASNDTAINFYLKMGMKEVDKTTWGNGVEGLVFHKPEIVGTLEEFM